MASVKDPPAKPAGAGEEVKHDMPGTQPQGQQPAEAPIANDGIAKAEEKVKHAAKEEDKTRKNGSAAEGQDAEAKPTSKVPSIAPPPPPRTSSHAGGQSNGSNGPAVPSQAQAKVEAKEEAKSEDDDEGEWQEMPVVRTITEENEFYAILDEEDRRKYKYQLRQRDLDVLSPNGADGAIPSGYASTSNKRRSGGGPAGNATGRHLDVDDARGYDWRSKPAGIESDESDEEEQGRGYTQLQLQEDEEAEQLHAATDYLFSDVAGTATPNIDGPAVTPASQLRTTKQLLTEGQRIAYVGLCSLLAKEFLRKISSLRKSLPKADLEAAEKNTRDWVNAVMEGLYQHMDIEGGERNMIDMLGEHGVLAADLAPTLATTQTIDNPDFDPEALREREEQEEEERQEREEREREEREEKELEEKDSAKDASDKEDVEKAEEKEDDESLEEDDEDDDGDIGFRKPKSAKKPSNTAAPHETPKAQTLELDEGEIADEHDLGVTPEKEVVGKGEASSEEKNEEAGSPSTRLHTLADPNSAAQVMAEHLGPEEIKMTDAEKEVSKTLGLTAEPQSVNPPPNALDGVTTEISTADKTITLDVRWTILCDLFLLLTSAGNYDARSRTLLEEVAKSLGLTWLDVTKFEKRITDTLELEEGAQKLRDQSVVDEREKQARKKRYLMMGLATVGGGLVIGLSAGLLAPLIGAGLGAALGTIGIGGTSTFLGGVGGAALITTTGTLSGAGIAGKGMSKRTRSVKVFEFKALHNKKRFNCVVAIPGFTSGPQDDVRLPFSVVDSTMGDLFSVLWEPDMMQEMGNAIGILWNETLASGVQQVLAVTIAGGLVGALTWPLWLTKLGYLIDNPWSNALDRAKAAGLILADVLARKQMGARPITLVGFSLGARVIYYSLLELYRQKAFGLVQNVYLVGTPVSPSRANWIQARSTVSGRFVNAFSKSDWILGYLHRATAGGLSSVAGLHPVENIEGIDNVDVTHLVPGHLAYRALMPLVLGELGFRTTADYFDEPEDLSKIPEREVVLEPTHFADEKESTPRSKFSFFRRKTDGTLTPSASTTSFSNGASEKGAQKSMEYEYDEDADEPEREQPRSSPSDPSLEKSVATGQNSADKSGAGTPDRPQLERERDASTAVVFDTDQILSELRAAGIEVKELETSLPPLTATTVEPSPSTAKSLSTPAPEIAESKAMRRPTIGSRENSVGFQASGLSSGYHTPSSSAMGNLDVVRDRTLSKPLPSIEADAAAAWVAPDLSNKLPAPTSQDAWTPSQLTFSNSPLTSEGPNDPFYSANPSGNISLTFASFDDDEIELPSTTATTTSHTSSVPGSLTAPSEPQLSFASEDGSITFSDDNPWQ